MLDGSGLVRRSQVFEGNLVKVTTLAGMLDGPGAPAGALLVMERGMATEANLVWLRTQGYCYLVLSRASGSEIAAERPARYGFTRAHLRQEPEQTDPSCLTDADWLWAPGWYLRVLNRASE